MSRRVGGGVPALFVLPFGYLVAVERGDCGNAWGEWDKDARVITLDTTLKKPAEIREIFLHEMEHVWKDWAAWVRRTRGTKNPDGPAEEPVEEATDGVD